MYALVMYYRNLNFFGTDISHMIMARGGKYKLVFFNFSSGLEEMTNSDQDPFILLNNENAECYTMFQLG
jgi:hypothetical protein